MIPRVRLEWRICIYVIYTRNDDNAGQNCYPIFFYSIPFFVSFFFYYCFCFGSPHCIERTKENNNTKRKCSAPNGNRNKFQVCLIYTVSELPCILLCCIYMYMSMSRLCTHEQSEEDRDETTTNTFLPVVPRHLATFWQQQKNNRFVAFLVYLTWYYFVYRETGWNTRRQRRRRRRWWCEMK